MIHSPDDVVLENSLLRAVILPSLGGKLASLKIKRLDLELLQPPLQPYRRRTPDQSFEDSDASGADDCLPTVSPCRIEWNGSVRMLPDHGDLWRIPCQSVTSGNSVRMDASLFSLPLHCRRQITLTDDTLSFHFEVRNTADQPIPYLWSAHPLFQVDAGDGIVLSPLLRHLTVGSSMRGRLGQCGHAVDWPHATDSQGKRIDLSAALGPETQSGDKLFAALPPKNSASRTWCGLYRRRYELGIFLRFSALQIPFLGLWLCYGGWPADRDQRQQCVALEPCFAATDSLRDAIDTGDSRTLLPGQTASWQMEWTIAGARQPVSGQEFLSLF